MKALALSAVVVLSTFSAVRGQTVLDESAKALDPTVVTTVLSSVADTLIDPVSAQFRKLRPGKVNPTWVCGEVNAKNRLGGYVGFAPFRYAPNLGVVIWSNSDDLIQRLSEARDSFGCFDENGIYQP